MYDWAWKITSRPSDGLSGRKEGAGPAYLSIPTGETAILSEFVVLFPLLRPLMSLQKKTRGEERKKMFLFFPGALILLGPLHI